MERKIIRRHPEVGVQFPPAGPKMTNEEILAKNKKKLEEMNQDTPNACILRTLTAIFEILIIDDLK